VVRTRRGGCLAAAMAYRQDEVIIALLSFCTRFLITDDYTAYQQLLPQLAGIQHCAQHVIRRCRAVAGLGLGRLQPWVPHDKWVCPSSVPGGGISRKWLGDPGFALRSM
jgi:hypothetical protein